MNNNRKMANRLAIVPASDEAFSLWEDIKSNNPEFTDSYWVFLAKGTEARARMHEMTRLLDKGASVEDVFFMHEQCVEEFRQATWAYETLKALQESL